MTAHEEKPAEADPVDHTPVEHDPFVPDELEPVPIGRSELAAPFSDPVPFGSPPDEEVTIVGDVPWELKDDGDVE